MKALFDFLSKEKSPQKRELFSLAEKEGFEPSIRFTACRFSRPVPSTTRPPLHKDYFNTNPPKMED